MSSMDAKTKDSEDIAKWGPPMLVDDVNMNAVVLGMSLDNWLLMKKLSRAEEVLWERAHWKQGRLGKRLQSALVRLASSPVVGNGTPTYKHAIFKSILRVFFPRHLKEFWETFMEYEGGVRNKSQFLSRVMSAVQFELNVLLICIDPCGERGNPDMLLDARKKFGQLLLTAPQPLTGGGSRSAAAGDGDALFTNAVGRGLLNEAVLLYDTGVVSPPELAALAQTQKVQEMLASDKNPTGMAAFLRKALKQSRSLESTGALRLAGLIGGDLKGKLDRARRLGLATALCDRVVNVRQTRDYLWSAEAEWSVAKKPEWDAEEAKMAAKLAPYKSDAANSAKQAMWEAMTEYWGAAEWAAQRAEWAAQRARWDAQQAARDAEDAEWEKVIALCDPKQAEFDAADRAECEALCEAEARKKGSADAHARWLLQDLRRLIDF